MKANELLKKLQDVLLRSQNIIIDERNQFLIEANIISESLLEITKNTYDSIADHYEVIRWEEPHDLDKKLWQKILSYVSKQFKYGYLIGDEASIKLLDIGTGNGRDLKYAQNNLGVDAIGIDNSNAFFQKVKMLENEKKLKENSIYLADMRDLKIFKKNTFDVVRHNATLLHIPVISKGYMADKAIEESYRVLKTGGIFYTFVKKGNGVDLVDTGEGLGARFYQFYDKEILRQILERNKLIILEISDETEIRGDKKIPWLSAFATKL